MPHRIRAVRPRTHARRSATWLGRFSAAFVRVVQGRGRTAAAPSRDARRRHTTVSGLHLLVRGATPPRLWSLTPSARAVRFQPFARAAEDLVSDFGEPNTLDIPGPLVRPYLVAYEQQERRRVLVLALDGIDAGPWVIHGHRLGTCARSVAA